ncbi:MAG: hypothetical protein IGS49_02165 [Chlorogloeopsis fritschii C42_A2020_084]|uniref:hypothetical protein n=1 Tax=Chlorogloeopsis fritschii TaxID=1124 RepID=UPI0019E40B06|nr:hypothetical protein [Chlorogloeopsis fritschii]MBF2004299.1 hypothetical protein [Chlorogloeopsis fritschii C42_A2020_084]
MRSRLKSFICRYYLFSRAVQTVTAVLYYWLVKLVGKQNQAFGIPATAYQEPGTVQWAALDQEPIAKEDNYVGKTKCRLLRTASG